MIRKTVRHFKRSCDHTGKKANGNTQHVDIIRLETWWVFILPIFSKEIVLASSI